MRHGKIIKNETLFIVKERTDQIMNVLPVGFQLMDEIYRVICTNPLFIDTLVRVPIDFI